MSLWELYEGPLHSSFLLLDTSTPTHILVNGGEYLINLSIPLSHTLKAHEEGESHKFPTDFGI